MVFQLEDPSLTAAPNFGSLTEHRDHLAKWRGHYDGDKKPDFSMGNASHLSNLDYRCVLTFSDVL